MKPTKHDDLGFFGGLAIAVGFGLFVYALVFVAVYALSH